MLSFSQAVRILLCILAIASPARGAEKPAGLSIVPEGWSVFVTQIVPGFNPRIPELKSVRELPLGTASFRKDPPHYLNRSFPGASSRVFDISGSMPDLLGSFSKDGVVLYHENSATLVAIAPANDIVHIEELLGGEFGHVASQVRVTATLAEMSVPHRSKIEGASYSRLRSIAGSSWKELEHIQLSTQSGQLATARSREESVSVVEEGPSDERAPLLANGEHGTGFKAEPVIDPDAQSVSLSFHWIRRDREIPKSLDVTASLIIGDGATVVVGKWPLPSSGQKGKPARTLVLALTVELITQDGTLYRDAFAQRLRQFRELTKTKQSKDKPAETDRAAERE